MPRTNEAHGERRRTRRGNQHSRRRGASPERPIALAENFNAAPPPIWPAPPPGTVEHQVYAWAVHEVFGNARALHEEASALMPAILSNLHPACLEGFEVDDPNEEDPMMWEDMHDQYLDLLDELFHTQQVLDYYQSELQHGRLVNLGEATVVYLNVKPICDVVKSLHGCVMKLATKRSKSIAAANLGVGVAFAVVLFLGALPHVVEFLEPAAAWLFNVAYWFATTNIVLCMLKITLNFLELCAEFFVYAFAYVMTKPIVVGILPLEGAEQIRPEEETTRMAEATTA
ncbi:uncharacterized protein PG986_014665 [Apiospora aurea]|uniref:Uncharacterized protein n=1 Tax=Apiospora aurea TaxID=335848 RepID=A0ABR1PTW8_9PEZI